MLLLEELSSNHGEFRENSPFQLQRIVFLG